MSRIKSHRDNPGGLHKRYAITKANGTPCDPNALYFVLRLDSGGSDREHIKACRSAAIAYTQAILNGPAFALHEMATDLALLVAKANSDDAKRHARELGLNVGKPPLAWSRPIEDDSVGFWSAGRYAVRYVEHNRQWKATCPGERDIFYTVKVNAFERCEACWQAAT